jgi:hypothetical protein
MIMNVDHYKILQARLMIAGTILKNTESMDPPLEVLQEINYAINQKEQDVLAAQTGWQLIRQDMYPFLLIMAFMFALLVIGFFVILIFYLKSPH